MLATLIITAAAAACNQARKPIFKPKFEVLAFYEKGWNDLTYGYPSLAKHYQDFDVLVPYWYTVNQDGSISYSNIGYEQQVEDFAKKHNQFKLVPLFNNGKGSPDVLLDNNTRAVAVKNIVKKVTDHNYAGVNIDFELLPPEAKNGLIAFISDLSKELKPKKKILSVSVFPKSDGGEEFGAAYDYGAIAKYADFITIMTYDKHSDSSEAGSVAPYDWVEKNIQIALKSIPKEQLTVCIGAYGYDWPVPASAGETEYIGLKEALQRASKHGAKIQWDDSTQSPFYTYTADDGTKHEVWFESGQSAARKIALAKKYGLRGIAIWRIGFEDEDYWKNLKDAIKK